MWTDFFWGGLGVGYIYRYTPHRYAPECKFGQSEEQKHSIKHKYMYNTR